MRWFDSKSEYIVFYWCKHNFDYYWCYRLEEYSPDWRKSYQACDIAYSAISQNVAKLIDYPNIKFYHSPEQYANKWDWFLRLSQAELKDLERFLFTEEDKSLIRLAAL